MNLKCEKAWQHYNSKYTSSILKAFHIQFQISPWICGHCFHVRSAEKHEGGDKRVRGDGRREGWSQGTRGGSEHAQGWAGELGVSSGTAGAGWGLRWRETQKPDPGWSEGWDFTPDADGNSDIYPEELSTHDMSTLVQLWVALLSLRNWQGGSGTTGRNHPYANFLFLLQLVTYTSEI